MQVAFKCSQYLKTNFGFALERKVSHSMCDPHEGCDNFCPIVHCSCQSFSTSLYHNLSVALIFLLRSLSHALSQYSITCTKRFLACTHLAPRSTGTHNSAGSRNCLANAGSRNLWVGVNLSHARL